MTPRPLARIASGGEVSRVMLACKVVLGEADARDTLVFDEVDAGVGGSVAVALAAVLADLAKTHQVIVVTHLAQVAVRGERHFMVKKTAGAAPNESEDANAAEAAIPETTLCELGEDERVREIARMLSGRRKRGLACPRKGNAQKRAIAVERPSQRASLGEYNPRRANSAFIGQTQPCQGSANRRESEILIRQQQSPPGAKPLFQAGLILRAIYGNAA